MSYARLCVSALTKSCSFVFISTRSHGPYSALRVAARRRENIASSRVSLATPRRAGRDEVIAIRVYRVITHARSWIIKGRLGVAGARAIRASARLECHVCRKVHRKCLETRSLRITRTSDVNELTTKSRRCVR